MWVLMDNIVGLDLAEELQVQEGLSELMVLPPSQIRPLTT